MNKPKEEQYEKIKQRIAIRDAVTQIENLMMYRGEMPEEGQLREILLKLYSKKEEQQSPSGEQHLSSEQRQQLFNFISEISNHILMDDELNQIEAIVYPKTYPYTLKDEAPSAQEIIERNTNPEFDTVERLRKRNNTIMKMLKQTITELRKAEVAYDNLCNSIGKAPCNRGKI